MCMWKSLFAAVPEKSKISGEKYGLIFSKNWHVFVIKKTFDYMYGKGRKVNHTVYNTGVYGHQKRQKE